MSRSANGRKSLDVASLSSLVETAERCASDSMLADHLLELAFCVNDVRAAFPDADDAAVAAMCEDHRYPGLVWARDELADGTERLRDMFAAHPGFALEFVSFLEAEVARLRAIPQRELEDLDAVVMRFVIAEEGDCFSAAGGSGLDVAYLFVRWLKLESFSCSGCGRRFVPLRASSRGRPRQSCSTACKQAAWRQRRRATEQPSSGGGSAAEPPSTWISEPAAISSSTR